MVGNWVQITKIATCQSLQGHPTKRFTKLEHEKNRVHPILYNWFVAVWNCVMFGQAMKQLHLK